MRLRKINYNFEWRVQLWSPVIIVGIPGCPKNISLTFCQINYCCFQFENFFPFPFYLCSFLPKIQGFGLGEEDRGIFCQKCWHFCAPDKNFLSKIIPKRKIFSKNGPREQNFNKKYPKMTFFQYRKYRWCLGPDPVRYYRINTDTESIPKNQKNLRSGSGSGLPNQYRVGIPKNTDRDPVRSDL